MKWWSAHARRAAAAWVGIVLGGACMVGRDAWGQKVTPLPDALAHEVVARKSQGPTCNARDLSLGWPLSGARGSDWEITNYVDLDERAEVRDYLDNRGKLARTYDGHTGVDVAVANFRRMEQGVHVHAMSAGDVLDVVDVFTDRNIAIDYSVCKSRQNLIRVRDSASGFVLEYLHIKRASARVRVGDHVERGTLLADLGSSGCSDGPHVHFTVLDCQGKVRDPFLERMFEQAPDYAAQLELMDSTLMRGGIKGRADVLNPAREAEVVAAGELIGVGAVLGGGRAGDALSLTITRPDHSVFVRYDVSLSGSTGFSWWYWNERLEAMAGAWTLHFSSGARSLGSRHVTVVISDPPAPSAGPV